MELPLLRKYRLYREQRLHRLVGAISAHGIVGIYGVMVVPFTSDASFLWQLYGVLAIAGFTYVASLVAIYVINMFIAIRATDEEQMACHLFFVSSSNGNKHIYDIDSY